MPNRSKTARSDWDECRWFCSGLLILAAGLAMPMESRADEPRPNLFGCGIVWGEWLSLPDADAKEWDRRVMDKIVQMGGTNCPANFAWIGIETTRGVYDWDYVDHQVADAKARGLEIFAYSGLTPDWALPPGILEQYGSGIGYRFPPDEQYIPDFEAFFQALADRYKGQVKYYEFWNEPNGCSWINDGCSNGHMADTYVPWLQRWYTAMKAGDPDCVLAVGGLDYNEGVTQGYQYIEDIYTYGGGNYFDAVAIHPYASTGLHWQAITDTYNVLVNHGHGYKKLWLNEYGWNTTDENFKAQQITNVLNTLKQPQYHMVFQANHLILTDLPHLPYTNHDYGLASSNLSTLTITPRQSWYAFQGVDKTWPEYAEFSATPRLGPASLVVQFTDESIVQNPTGWLWQFGDGQTSDSQDPSHTFTADGSYTVRLTVAGSSGSFAEEKTGYIVLDSAGVYNLSNPSFEDNGGSLNGWEITQINSGPDNPPHNSGDYGVFTTFGDHFAGKITSWGKFAFRLGQIVQVAEIAAGDNQIDLDLSAHVQLHSRQPGGGTPANTHQKWQVGWNNDGSMPSDIDSCDNYQTLANIDGTHTGNDANNFHPLTVMDTLSGVPAFIALRVEMWNDYGVEWTMSNMDNVSFSAVAVGVATVAPDLDGDTDVDLEDFGHLQACLTGPSAGPPDAGCDDADFDGDNDVDLADYGLLQRCFSGANIPADPNCADQ